MAKPAGKVNGKQCAARLWTRMAKEDPARAARLAEALRQNLRRRKAQARESYQGPATGDSSTAPPAGGSEPVKEPPSPS
jgi:hypothetical protein